MRYVEVADCIVLTYEVVSITPLCVLNFITYILTEFISKVEIYTIVQPCSKMEHFNYLILLLLEYIMSCTASFA